MYVMRIIITLSLTTVLLSACATAPPASDIEAYAEYQRKNDPIEPINKGIFAFNMAFDSVVARPIVKTYVKIVPGFAQQGLSNFMGNLMHPWTAANEILQGKPLAATNTIGRFAVNSTLGIGGLFDPATKFGMAETEEDLGQTLAVWGVPSGPYLMLPFFGPSNLRDTVGLAGEFVGDPVGYAIDRADVLDNALLGIDGLSYIRFGVDAFTWRVRADVLFDELHHSPNPYAAARTAYRDLRAFEIADGELIISEEEDDLFDDDFEDIDADN